MSKLSSKAKCIIVIIAICVAIAVAGTVFAICKNTNVANVDTNGNNNQQQVQDDNNNLVELTVPNTITIDYLQRCKFEYTSLNLQDFKVDVTIQNEDIASLDEDLNITPLKVGTTKIITTINCTPCIQKQTTLIVEDAVTDFSYKFLNMESQEQSFLYVGNSYYLEITENATVNALANIGFDNESVSDFMLISKEGNVVKYKFNVAKCGEFDFDYVSKYCHKSTGKITAYVYPNTFDVSFDNVAVVDNKFSLYLSSDASLSEIDGLFESCSYCCLLTENSNDQIEVSVTGDCVEIENQKVTAKKEGLGSVVFVSKISGYKLEYIVNVKKVKPTKIAFNNKEFDVGAELQLSIKVNEPADFQLLTIPSYAYGNLTFEYGDGVKIEDNKITLLGATDETVYAKKDNSIVATITVKAKSEQKIIASVYICSAEHTFKNNILNISYTDNCQLILKLEIVDATTLQPYSLQIINFIIEDETVITSTDNSNLVKNNYASFQILKSGTTSIEFYSSDLGINNIITINIA